MSKYSEVLEIVDKMANYILLDEEYGFIDAEEKQSIIKDRDTIKQALLKAQEQEKALEIIYKKNVDTSFLRNSCDTVEEYNKEIINNIMYCCYSNCRKLTKKEFELVREVLCDDTNI